MDIKRFIVDLAPAPIVRIFAAPYVAGKGIEAGVTKADEIWKTGTLTPRSTCWAKRCSSARMSRRPSPSISR